MNRTISSTTRAIVAAIMVVVGVLAAGIGVAVAVNSEPFSFSAAPEPAAADDSFTVRGTLSLTCTRSCVGYSDIQDGSQVEVVNDRHEVLTVTTLNSITSSAGYSVSRSYEFVAQDVPRGEKLYGVKIGNANRGVIWKSEAEAATDGFALTLG